jgi:tetratricopeptide (TPR) repeat protein
LGWGQKVLDTDATAAAAALYGALAAGYELTEALSRTYQALIKQQARDWHLLRLYVAGTLPGQLVTTLRTRGRKPAPKPSVTEQFLDPAGTVKVPTRGSFVGRRRQLQNCLRALRGVAPLTPQPWGGQQEGQTLTPPSFGGPGGQCLGVLIHGMGGLGKSSLAARLCDRLPEFERLVWVGRVDEPSLVNKLAAALDSRELREALQDDKEQLKFRLRRVFRQLEDPPNPPYQGGSSKPFLLVLDDFEANLEPRDGGYVLQPEAVTVLEALVWAIDDTYARHRLILTCRYDFESILLQEFYKQPLEGMRGADLRKKCSRLTAFDAKSQVDEALQSQARRLADGNPRLLEWLDKVLLNLDPPQPPRTKVSPDIPPLVRGARGVRGEQNTVAEILARLEADPVELREQVLAEALLEQIDKQLEEMLQRGLVFELPVPREALAAVCEGIPNLDRQINRAVALGLLEVSPDESLRVPRILPLKLPEDSETLHQQAAEVLYRLWWDDAESSTEEQQQEVYRLALRGKAEKIAVEVANILLTQWLYRSRFREVIKTCKETLEIFKDYGILYRLASAERELGEFDKALDNYQKALESCPPEAGEEKAEIIYNLARLRANEEKIAEAITLYKQSLEISKGIGNVKTQAAILHQLAILNVRLGQIPEAIALCQQSLALTASATESIGNVQGKAATLHLLAVLKVKLGGIEEAIALYEQSLELSESIGDLRGKAITLGMIGQLLVYEKGDFATALNCLQQSLEILQRLQLPDAEKVKEAITRVQQMRDDIQSKRSPLSEKE